MRVSTVTNATLREARIRCSWRVIYEWVTMQEIGRRKDAKKTKWVDLPFGDF